MINKIIRNFIAKQMAGRSDDGIMITLRDPQKVELGENIMADLLMRNGFNPADITSERQLKNILNQIEAASKQTTQSGIKNTESAKIFEIATGKEIPKGSKIMGGQAVDDLPPPGSRGGSDDIAAPVQSSEETLKNMIMAENKKNIAAMKKRKMLDDAIENQSPSLTGDRKYDADIVAEDLAERMGLVYDDMPIKERLNLYDEAYQALTKKKFDPPEDLATGGRVGLKDGFPSREENLKLLKEELKEIFKKQTDPFPKPGSNQFKDFKLKLENILSKSRLKSADGGIMRIGLKEGSGMTRRTFLKFLAGAASIPIVGKIFKPFKVGKTVTKIPIIKTDNVPGKPEWFDQLVNKVILEGDDVTKQFATKEREIVHVKTLEKGSNRIDPNTGEIVKPGTPLSDDVTVKVTQDLDEGAVRVEYQSPENVYGDPVQLRYKKPNPDEGDPRPSAEFDTAESGPVGRAFGPDDYEIEIDELGGTSISDLTSDVSKLKEYATGQKPTLKEIVQKKKRKDKAARISEGGEDEMQAVIDRQGEFIQFDDLDPGDYASGGIARMLGE